MGLLLTLNLLSVVGVFRFALSSRQDWRREWPWLVLWAVAGLLGIYTHYFGFFVMAFGVLGLLIVGWQRWEVSDLLRQRWVWLGLVAAGLAALPIVPIALERFGAGRQIDFESVPLGKVLANGLSAFAVGMSRTLVHPAWQVGLVVLLVVVGWLLLWRRHRLAAGLLLAYQVVPIGLLLLLSLINPLYNGTRHLLIGLPPFLVALALGVGGGGLTGFPKPVRSVWRVGRPLLILFTLGGQLLMLRAQFQAVGLVRDDVRGAAIYLNEFAEADDVVVVHDSLIRFTFDYYYEGAAPVISVPHYSRWRAEAEEIGRLAAAGEGARRIWFLTEPLPRDGFSREVLLDWAEAHWQEVMTERFPWMWLRVGLKLYVPERVVAAVTETSVAQDLTWDGGLLRLQGVEAPETAVAGDDWFPTFYWSQTGAERDYQVSLRFVDEGGQVWGEVGWPLWPFSRPEDWPAGQVVREDRRVVLPTGLPPGRYGVWLRLVDVVTGEAVLVNGLDLDVLLWPDFVVEPNVAAQVADLPAHEPLMSRWPDVALVGFGLETADYRPGHAVPVTVYWQVLDEMKTEYEWVVQLLDPAGQLAAETITAPTRGDYPTTLWQQGELLQGLVQLTVPSRAEKGEYTVQVGLRDRESGRFVRRQWFGSPLVQLGTVSVKPWSLRTELPPIAVPLAVTFGEPVLANLAGVEMAETAVVPGSVLPLTLIWQAQQETDVNYRLFLHLTNGEGEIVAQRDILPMNGSRPTPSWRVGEVLVDEHELWLGTEVTPGEYELWLGLADVGTGERLAVFDGGVAVADGRYLLGIVRVGDE